MRDIAPSRGRPTLNKPRARRDAAKVLAVNLQARYRAYLEATGNDEIMVATGALAQCMIENIEFMIWALKSIGGMNPAPPEELNRISPAPKPETLLSIPTEDPRFAKPPEFVLEEEKTLDLPCNCPVLEAGIIGRDKHMTSCPKYVP